MERVVEARITQWLILVIVVIAGILLFKGLASYIPDRGGWLSAFKRLILAA